MGVLHLLMGLWNTVSTLEELEAFLNHVGHFHDGVLKEVHWVNQDFVNEALCLLPEQLATARLLVQRQWKDPSAVEIVLKRVWSLKLDTVAFIFDSMASTEPTPPGEPPLQLLRLDLEASVMTFERMYWRDASEMMGADVRFGPFELPFDD